MMQVCRIRAHEVMHVRLPEIETKYEGQRTDGTHALNGTAWMRGRTETFQCSFDRPGRQIVQFVVNQPSDGATTPPEQPSHEPMTRTERVQFPPGTTGTDIKGALRSGDSVRYVVRANKRQFLYARVATDNRRTYFNIFTPDGNTLYKSARAGDEYRGQLWLDGDHIVEVYNVSPGGASYSAIFSLERQHSSRVIVVGFQGCTILGDPALRRVPGLKLSSSR
jgi:hypothetical protein